MRQMAQRFGEADSVSALTRALADETLARYGCHSVSLVVFTERESPYCDFDTTYEWAGEEGLQEWGRDLYRVDPTLRLLINTHSIVTVEDRFPSVEAYRWLRDVKHASGQPPWPWSLMAPIFGDGHLQGLFMLWSDHEQRAAVRREALVISGHVSVAMTRLHRRPSRLILTARQSQVAELVCRGFTNAEIGNALGISLDTAKKHILCAFDRLGISSRAELAAIASTSRSRLGSGEADRVRVVRFVGEQRPQL